MHRQNTTEGCWFFCILKQQRPKNKYAANPLIQEQQIWRCVWGRLQWCNSSYSLTAKMYKPPRLAKRPQGLFASNDLTMWDLSETPNLCKRTSDVLYKPRAVVLSSNNLFQKLTTEDSLCRNKWLFHAEKDDRGWGCFFPPPQFSACWRWDEWIQKHMPMNCLDFHCKWTKFI